VIRGWTACLLLILTAVVGVGQEAVSPPTEVKAYDRPNDAGLNMVVTWRPSPDEETSPERVYGYEILRAEDPEGPYGVVGFVGRGIERWEDQDVPRDGTPYYYKVRTVGEAGSAESAPSGPAVSRQQWFHTGRINNLIGVAAFIALVVWSIFAARSGRSTYIRRIAGLDAVEEAVGRATEMGRPILYIPGISTMSDVATIAALNILSQVAKKTATYETRLVMPNADPIVFTVAQQIVKEAYTEVGRPDLFNPDDVFFITDSQMGYAAAVDGIMVREQPATNFFLGMFYAESLVLAETGATTGAIQIAGTDAVNQLPFFITACDYTLLGEELYAASAYLSRDPTLLGSLKGQDWYKAIIVGVTLVATAIALIAHNPSLVNLFQIE
jgi:hypothetical protein